MRTFKLILAYDGTRYSGWQLQPDRRTVQEELEAALARITQTKLRILGASRTDAGVHALGQLVSFESDTPIAADKLIRGLNHELPEDIIVRELVDAPAGFHAIRHSFRKRYRYVIYDGQVPDLLRRHYSWHVGKPLDPQAMHRAAQGLVGKHDFSTFESSGAERKTSIRTVFELSVTRETAPADELWSVARAGQGGAPTVELPFIRIEIEADGFLYNMVRSIAGTLYEVGRAHRPEEWPRQIMETMQRSQSGRTAPAHGLFLLWVKHLEPPFPPKPIRNVQAGAVEVSVDATDEFDEGDA